MFILLLNPLAAICSQHPPATVEMVLERVSQHVYYVQGAPGIATDNQGFISNATAIVTSEGLVIVDAVGSPSLAERFLALVREVTDKPVVKFPSRAARIPGIGSRCSKVWSSRV